MQEVNDYYKNKGVQIIGVVADSISYNTGVIDEGTKNFALKLLNQKNAKYLNLVPTDIKLRNYFNQFEYVPTQIIIDEQGNILGKPEVGARSAKEFIEIINKKLSASKANVGKIVTVKAIELNKKNLSLKLNSAYKLLAIIKPANASNKKLLWKSSNTNLVSINEIGEIKAEKVGKAVITVYSADKKVKSECKITITK